MSWKAPRLKPETRPHDVGGGAELVAVDPCREEPVGVAVDGLERGGPGVEDLDGLVAVGGRAAHPPAQRVLVRGVDVVVELRVVLAVAAADDDRGGAGGPGGLGVAVGDELVPAREPRFEPRVDLGLHAVEVGLGVQQAGVHGLSGDVLGAVVLGRGHAEAARSGDREAARGDRALDQAPPFEVRALRGRSDGAAQSSAARDGFVHMRHGAPMRHAVCDAGECNRVSSAGDAGATPAAGKSKCDINKLQY